MENRTRDLSWSHIMMALLLILMLAVCYGTTAAGNDSATSDVAKSSQQYDQKELASLAQRDAGKPLTLADASVMELDGVSTLVLTFSLPLNPDIQFANSLSLVDKASGKVDGDWELSANLMELHFRHLQPARELQLTINPGIRAVNGAELTLEKSSYEYKTPEMQPAAGFVSKGSLLPTRLAAGLPILALNVDQVDIDFFRINNTALPSFIAKWHGRSNLNRWDADDYVKAGQLVYTGRFDLKAKANTRQTILLPIQDIEPLRQAGVYLAVLRQSGQYSSYLIPMTLFTISDIGLSVHRYQQKIDVFAQTLEQGKSLANVKLSILDEKGAVQSEGQTDKKGHASLARPESDRVLLATLNGQTSMIPLNQPALDLSEFAIGGAIGHDVEVFAFGPRDIYRPGDTLIVNALLRDANGKQVPEQPINVDLLNQDGHVVRSFVWRAEGGLYQFVYAIPGTAGTGEWSLRMKLGDNQPRYYKFKVEDFLPERMALDLKAEEGVLAPEDAVSFTVNGRYLYGAPAAGNSLEGQLFLRPDREAVKQLPGFEFGSVTEKDLSRRLEDVELDLDEQGQGEVSIDSEWEKSRSPMKVILQASLMESGGRPVNRTVEQVIWPAEQLPGVRPLFGTKPIYDYTRDKYQTQAVVDEGGIAEFELVYSDVSGAKLATPQDLQVQLVRERRDYYWSWDSEGWNSRYNQTDLVMDTRTIAIAAGGTAKVAFNVDWGAYRIEVRDPVTEVVSSYRFWAGYSWQDNTDGSGAVRPDQVKLKLDKPFYQPGDSIKLNVQAPAAGKGYLLVESGAGPLWWQEIDVPEGGTDFTIPVSKEWQRHDIYLSALVIRPGDRQKQLTPKRAVGLLHLPLADPQRRLQVSLEAPAKIEPDSALKVKVKVQAAKGKATGPVHVLVSAVDVGILNITDYKTPDPYMGFLSQRRYNVDIMDVYGQLIEGKGQLASLRFGGDGDDLRGGKKPVTPVLLLSLQADQVIVNERGEAEVEFAIPEFNGELRLMAQAWSDEEYGSGESKVVVAAPLVMELSAPRFMAGGDVSRLVLDLNNLSGAAQQLQVQATTQGLLDLSGEVKQLKQTVSLEKDKKGTVTIPVVAKQGFGQGEIRVTVKGLKLPDRPAQDRQRSWKLGIRPATPAETRLQYALLKPGETWQVPLDSFTGLNPQTLSGTLLLTSRPPLNLADHIKELYAYPYGCVEQTTSGLFPSLYTSSSQLKALGIKTGTDQERRESVELGIERILAMQRTNGAFGLWSDESAEEFWGTVYVTDFLLQARAQGYLIPEKALQKATERVQRYLQDVNQIDPDYTRNRKASQFAVQSYAALVLARQQKAPLGALRQIAARSSDSFSGLSLVQLGVALQLMGDRNRAAHLIEQGMEKKRTTEWIGDYGSDIRDQAAILALMYEYHLQPEQQDQRLLLLSDDLLGQRYLSTQERNALYMVGRFMLGHDEKHWRARLGAQKLTDSKAHTLVLSGDDLATGLSVSNSGESTLYPRLHFTSYPLTTPKPVSQNLSITREFFNAEGEALALENIKSGDLVFVHLRIKAESGLVPDALVVDLLPAGLELENQNLASSSASLGQSAGGALQLLLTNMQKAEIKHQEFRDDRYVAAVKVEKHSPVDLLYLARAVTPGSYRVPAPMVESMYRPDWRAVGETPERLVIKNK